ncbi:OmpA family protein [Anianabacter salinae]|uniref:OmpA family protein n=1 Tax=Anianabacter salinae TaxID=2851023 RepID=UPI00225E1C5B|nr:OmpA family protein [Anianabacter salinae]MBV0911286.1 OmpA family protein [Anianabacter salinae]
MSIRPITRVGLVALSVLTAGACAPRETYRDLFREAGSGIDNGSFGNATANNLSVQQGDEGYLLGLDTEFQRKVPATIYFDFNSSALNADAVEALRQQAAFIRSYPAIRFSVYGHADAVGSAAYNKRLGLKRAQVAVAYLVSLGVERDRLEALVSFGESQLAVPTQDRERQNRRAMTRVAGYVNASARTLDGKYAKAVYDNYITSARPAPGIAAASGGASAGGTTAGAGG